MKDTRSEILDVITAVLRPTTLHPKNRPLKQKRQYAALSYRIVDGIVEVMLVTSRDTGRWVIPKGWPKKRLAPHKLAMLEAYEEAGIRGTIKKRPVGRFHYIKRMEKGPDVQCRVEVFPMQIKAELAEWPEMNERTRQWVTAEAAAGMVKEPELAEILRAFSPDA